MIRWLFCALFVFMASSSYANPRYSEYEDRYPSAPGYAHQQADKDRRDDREYDSRTREMHGNPGVQYDYTPQGPVPSYGQQKSQSRGW